MTIRTLFAGAIALGLAVTLAAGAHGQEKTFVRLGDREIAAKVIGREITDGVHWSDYFRWDGVILSQSMGHKSNGKWRVRNGELCTTKESLDEEACYQVWVAGEEISLRLDGFESPFIGYLRKHTAP